jgi:chemosensory pili system protein ChpC
MTIETGSVRSLLIPVHGHHLIVPNVAVAEVIPYQRANYVGKAPAWLLGAIGWRGLTVPVVSYEAAKGGSAMPPVAESRIAIINTIRGEGSVPFYAMVTAGIPRLYRVSHDCIEEREGRDVDDEGTELCRALIDGEAVVVPDLDALEELIARYWLRAA